MSDLLGIIDRLSDSELVILNDHLEGLEKRAEERLNSINMGRQMARDFSKVASALVNEAEDRVSGSESFKSGLKKMSSQQRFSLLFSPKDPGECGLEKLASSEYFYESGAAALSKILGLLFK